MAAENVHVYVLKDKIPPPLMTVSGGNTGARLTFHGVVRGEENETSIVALFYEAYEEMAEKELTDVCSEAAILFDLQQLECWHRIDEVKVDEASLQIVMLSRHRGSGLEAMSWLVREIKARVPIWKWGVTADGERFPSTHIEQHSH